MNLQVSLRATLIRCHLGVPNILTFRYLLSIFLSFGLAGCASSLDSRAYSYGTQNNAALSHYHKGWELIMDFGLWTDSEQSFRKAVQVDPKFALGWSLVGRISNSFEEREAIIAKLAGQERRDVPGQFLLKTYLSNVRTMNARETGTRLEPAANVRHAESRENLRRFLLAYPNEPYVLAEFIELTHALDGAQVALDLILEVREQPRGAVPFFLRYQAALEAEIGNFQQAKALSREFASSLGNMLAPEPFVLAALISQQMGLLKEASQAVNQAVLLDDKHLVAQALKQQIEKDLAARRPIP